MVKLSVEIILTSMVLLFSREKVVIATNKSTNCVFPVIKVAYYDDDETSRPVVKVLNSNYVTKSTFPFQFILMNCTAPYPIEWIADTPQNYYYSYILENEVRTVIPPTTRANLNLAENRVIPPTEEFTVRLHIGNQTLTKVNNGSAFCSPIDMPECGSTAVEFQIQEEGKTLVNINFERISPDSKLSPDHSNLETRPKPRCPWYSSTFENVTTFSKNVSEFLCETPSSKGIRNYSFQPCMDEQVRNSTFAPAPVLHFKFNESRPIPPTGVFTCKSKHEGKLTIPYFLSLPKCCQNERHTLPHLYLSSWNSSSIREEDFLSLCIQNGTNADIYVGDNITITCISSIFYFAEGLRLEVVSKSKSERNDFWEDLDISNTTIEFSFGPKGYRNATTILNIPTTRVYKIECKAPVRKSRQWVTKTVITKIKVQKPLIFDGPKDRIPIINDQGAGTHLLCNASGDPLPKLSWSRLSNGKLPEGQNEPTYSPIQSKTSWVASTLHFNGTNQNMTGYYGRYICTASNQFESIEKMFVLEKDLDEITTSIFNSYDIGKVIIFWTSVVMSILAVVGIVAFLGFKIREQSKRIRLFTKAEVDEFLFGNPELLLEDSDNYHELNSYASYLPYDRNKFEIRRELLEFDEKDILGSGAFGTVYQGLLHDSRTKESQTVAIKTVHASSDKMYFSSLLSEIKIMCYIGSHENVIEFLGACTKFINIRQIFVVTEFCVNGDLLSYIRGNQISFENYFNKMNNPSSSHLIDSLQVGYCRLSDGKNILSMSLLMTWALQIANGMAFLSSKKVIHGDLAARNVLLTSDRVPKIGDFGLSKQLQKYSNYIRKNDDLVPWRWLAIESLQYMKFSVKSDVWAFGVVLYEMFSLGLVPYVSHSYTEHFVETLSQGERLPKPKYASKNMYTLMLACWNFSPNDRPTFFDIQNTFQSLGKTIQFEDDEMKDMQINNDKKVDHSNFDYVVDKNIFSDAFTATKNQNSLITPTTTPVQLTQTELKTGYVDWNF